MKSEVLPSVKWCSMCECTKPSSDFFKNYRDGFSPYCKPCSAQRKRKGDKTKSELMAIVYPSDKTKVCSKCLTEKDRSLFNGRVRDGRVTLRPYCKECQTAIYKNWAKKSGKQKFESRQDQAIASIAITYPGYGVKLCRSCNEVKPSEYFGKRFESGGVCKECRSKFEAISYSKNKEARQAYAKQYREKNLGAVREMSLAGAKRRYLVLKEARSEDRATNAQKMQLIAQFGYKCMCCGAVKKISFDHIIPISKGGKDVIDNLQLLCVPCNSSKARKTIDYRPNGFERLK